MANDGDLTYAKVRLDEGSLALASKHLRGFDDSLTQLIILSSIWDSVRDGELPAAHYVELVHQHLPAITHSSGLLVQLRQLATALDAYVPHPHRRDLRVRTADRLWTLTGGARRHPRRVGPAAAAVPGVLPAGVHGCAHGRARIRADRC